jgi:sortase (surface protein transpeptidase)
MTGHEHRRSRARSVLLIDLLVAVLVLGGVGAFAYGRATRRHGPPPVRVAGDLPTLIASPPHPSVQPSPVRSSAEPTVPSPSVAPTAIPRAIPLSVSIPDIGVDSRLVRLGLNPDGTLEVPTDVSVAGWYEFGPSPGQSGPAVIVGHVDSKRGPAVFFKLGSLEVGSLVRVTLEGRTELLFRVYAVREVAKTAFPTKLVYGATPGPELRLVTCGGAFDASTGHYLDNIVVFARSASG